MSIDTTKIKAGDWPEGVSFICVDGDGYSEAHGDRFPWEPFTAHRPAITWDGVPHTNEDPDHTSEPASEVSDGEWVTTDELWYELSDPDMGIPRADLINALLTRKLSEGKLPVVAKRDVARAVFRKDGDTLDGLTIHDRLAALGITPDLLDGGAE